MGIREVERGILAELKQVSGRQNLRIKDMLEWQTGKGLTAQPGEKVYYLPVLMISVAVKDKVTK